MCYCFIKSVNYSLHVIRFLSDNAECSAHNQCVASDNPERRLTECRVIEVLLYLCKCQLRERVNSRIFIMLVFFYYFYQLVWPAEFKNRLWKEWISRFVFHLTLFLSSPMHCDAGVNRWSRRCHVPRCFVKEFCLHSTRAGTGLTRIPLVCFVSRRMRTHGDNQVLLYLQRHCFHESAHPASGLDVYCECSWDLIVHSTYTKSDNNFHQWQSRISSNDIIIEYLDEIPLLIRSSDIQRLLSSGRSRIISLKCCSIIVCRRLAWEGWETKRRVGLISYSKWIEFLDSRQLSSSRIDVACTHDLPLSVFVGSAGSLWLYLQSATSDNSRLRRVAADVVFVVFCCCYCCVVFLFTS